MSSTGKQSRAATSSLGYICQRCACHVFAVLLTPLLSGALCNAANIGFVGSTEGNEVLDWRTSTTAKTLDIDGNNLYGVSGSGSTIGAVQWGVGVSNQQSQGSTTLGWAYVGGSGFAINESSHIDVDHVLNAPDDFDAGIRTKDFTFELTGTAADYLNRTVRIGIMEDVFSDTAQGGDKFKGFRITQVLGGSGDSGITVLRGGGQGNGVPEMYFWDITLATAGDRFQILALADQGGTSGQVGYMGPVSWDLSPAPEPSGLALVAIAGISVAGLARRRHFNSTRAAVRSWELLGR